MRDSALLRLISLQEKNYILNILLYCLYQVKKAKDCTAIHFFNKINICTWILVNLGTVFLEHWSQVQYHRVSTDRAALPCTVRPVFLAST